MVVTRKNDEAVSPVIGVILMVAITVILAAVIAAFVFGMSGNITKTKIVAVTTNQPDATHISVTYNGGQDAQTVNAIMVTVDGATSYIGGAEVLPSVWMNTTYAPDAILQVGTSITAEGPDFAGRDHVVATGYFSDGAQQVLLDTYV